METLTRKIWTDEELLALPRGQGKYQLIDGELIKMGPAGGCHEHYTLNIGTALRAFLESRRLGMVLVQALDTGSTRTTCSAPTSLIPAWNVCGGRTET